MPAVSRGRERGSLAIVLHTHMPYVEGYGTWPSGEEWLWEAIAGSYLPLLDLLDEGAPLTLSLTPVLCDQLEAPGVYERFEGFVRDVRRATHERDAAGLRAGGYETLARELERAWSDYEDALASLHARGGELLGSLARHAQWTSSATHAVLPLLASDAGMRLQLRSGIAAHRRRFGAQWSGGLWLPECAYASWLERALEEAGVAAVCVELTARLGLGAREHLRPIVTDAGVRLVPVDRATISLVWSERGYPAAGAYRDYHHHTVHHHNPWSNDGGAYDHPRALALAGEHAADFVARARARLSDANAAASPGARLPGGGLVVCALDTELLGHWWYEGPAWLRAVVEECTRQGLELVRLDDALERIEPVARGELVQIAQGPDGLASSWGSGGDLSTWSGPAVAQMAFAMRAAELRVVGAGERAGAIAARELLALQASDWPFMVSRALAGPYPHERFAGHALALARALEADAQTGAAPVRTGAARSPLPDASDASDAQAGAGRRPHERDCPPGPRNLAIDADRRWLLAP
ncbi:MAG TPA: 1,4-alpha-glucan branching protein domain-containing protein [Solirubrobacteraceae bacterium]|nr:1,4-alpha-glucan branching protein domain-containing protein [Solirubrobacteraceae bacterium]